MTGKTRTLEVDVSPDVLARWERGEDIIQNLMPHLSPNEREFIKTGIVQEEWDTLKEEDEE
jgi:hypothetical protein